MRTSSTTFGDILYVLKHLSEQSKVDTQNHSEWATLKRAWQWNKDWSAVTAWIDGKPAFIFGVMGVEEKLTWFLATDAYWQSGAKGMLASRRILKAAKKKHGPLFAVTLSQREDVDRWFKLLGFQKLSETRGQRVYKCA